MRFTFLPALFVAIPGMALAAGPLATLNTESASIGIGAAGSLSSITRRGVGRDSLAPGQPAPLLQLRYGGKLHRPDRASWEEAGGRLTLHYPEVSATAVVKATAKPTHVLFELVEVQPADGLELALWGPYPIAIAETIGEIVGVVRDRETAVGIQALNPKTLGGFPDRENDLDAGYGADDTGHYPDLPEELKKGQGFRGDTARATAFGSVLQAYCRQRNQERLLPNWGHERYRVPAFPDGGVVGSRIALFACPAPEALATIGAIELAEGLPHPLLDGVWGKVSPGATASYLIVDFGEETVDRAIEMTRRAGLRYLYHSSPFSTWGHFQLKPALFPHGWEGLRACVEKGRRAGVRIGFHTLSNFITPNDAYVTPVPDPRLAPVGHGELAAAVEAGATELPIREPHFFSRKSDLNTVQIGQELIRFEAASKEPPWRLLGCERGAWGTRASAHPASAGVARLLDHPYKVFFGDADLSQEIAQNIAQLCNRCGALQLSFDGLEGNLASGYGQYGQALFTKAWYDALEPGVRGQVINDASNPGHFNWHINTRMNWGEPWYAGFRESQTLYRFKNQVLFERNLMPHMLGWFALRPDTSVEDAEWLLARAAGFDAGFTLATSLASTAQLAADPSSADTAREFGATARIFEAIRLWETARMSGAFPPAVKALLRDNAREFHLQSAGDGRWELFEAHVARFSLPPGAAASSSFTFQNPAAPQGLQFTVRSTAKVPVARVRLEVNGRLLLDLKEQAIPAGGGLRYDGGTGVVVVDSAWKELARLPVAQADSRIPGGAARVMLHGEVPDGAILKAELRTLGSATSIAATRR